MRNCAVVESAYGDRLL